MTRTATALVLLVSAATVLALPALATDRSLDTRVTMLIGFAGDGDEDASVLVVPGTVIPVAEISRRQTRPVEDGAERARMVQDLADKLQRAIGLDSMEVAYSEVHPLTQGEPSAVSGPRAESTIRGELTLLDFNDRLATYRIELRQGAALLADSKVAVERGGRAVVGGLDGDEAPYFFLVLEPPAKALFVRGDVTHPRKLNAVPPRYTEEARKEGIQGIVILQALINEEGLVEEVEALEELPYGLTETAIEALRQWTFEPATLEGRPVSVYYNLTFNFRLSDGEEEGDPAPEG